MKFLSYFRSLVAKFFHRSLIERDVDEELRSHIQHRADDLERSGLDRVEAERRARIEFGGYEKFRQESHEALGGNFVETLLQDIRFSLRMLRKSPGFTAVVVATLALGIGANTAIFSLVNAVLLRSIPVRSPEQLVVLEWSAHSRPNHVNTSSFGDCADFRDRGTDRNDCSLSYPVFREIRDQKNVFSAMAAFAGPAGLDLSGNGQASIARGELVSGDYFETLGVPAALGRTLEAADEQSSAAPVAVLDYGYWETAFGSSPNVVGKTIRLNNVLFTIVGVADRGFTRLTPGKSVDLWVPLTQLVPLGLSWGGADISSQNAWWLSVVGRLRPRVSRTQAQAVVSALFVNATLHGAKPAWKESDHPSLVLVPAQEGLSGIRQQFGEPLKLLMAAVGIVLLIACANVAGLLLARGAAREKEMAVRLALGASRRRVVRQLLTESLLLSFAGSMLGALFAYAGASSLTAFFNANAYSAIKIDVHPDASVLLFAIAIALLTGIVFGLAPALRGAHTNTTEELKGSRATTTMHGTSRRLGLGNSLVVLQVALSMVVLVGAGLLLRTLEKLRSIDPGFDTRNVLLFSINPELAGYKENQIQNLYDKLQKRLETLPGVVSASYSSDALLDGSLSTRDVRIQGRTEKSTGEMQVLAVGADFFQTMKIPLATGRLFRATDLSSTEPVAVVNQAFVRQFLGAGNPLGVHFGGSDAKDPQWEIVGVVGNTKYDTLRRDVAPIAYFPLKKGGATFALRIATAPGMLIPALRKTVNDLDSNLPVISIKTQSETVDRLLFNERLMTRLFGLFGALGLVLACIGLYGLLSYEVTLRTREIGIRTALGAQRRDVLAMILRQGLMLVLLGSAAGAIAAVAVTRLLENLLFGIRPTDPATFVAVAGLLVLVGVLACFLPARRAAHVDPMVALRCE